MTTSSMESRTTARFDADLSGAAPVQATEEDVRTPLPDLPAADAGSRSWRRTATLAVAGLCMLLVVSVLGLIFGTAHIPWRDALGYVWAAMTHGRIGADDLPAYRIIVESRLPRVLTAALVGAGLSVVGVVVQAMVRNSLADPYVLGISSGASVGATAVVLFGAFAGLGLYAMPVAAFVGALIAAVTVFVVAATPAGLSPLRLVLTGTALAYGFSALTTVLVFLAPQGDAARSVMFWLLGSLAAVTWNSVLVVAPAVLVGGGLMILAAGHLNALSMGDEVAASLGLRAARVRLVLFVVSALLTGVMVSVCGAVGFVGLIVPHVTRLMIGADHRRVLVLAPVIGSVFLVVADLCARVAVPPQELPLSAVTAAVGVPVFLGLMRRRRGAGDQL